MPEPATDIQSAAQLTRLLEASRAVHLGIALGDAADHLKSGKPVLRGGVATQLTLATSEGVIRTLERGGRGLPVDWSHETLASLGRWARGQSIAGCAAPQDGALGLLSTLPGYAARRGSAPATVRALRTGVTPFSLGAHGLIRVLPLGSVVCLHPEVLTHAAVEIATSTHRHATMVNTVEVALHLVAQAAGPAEGLAARWLTVLEAGVPEGPVHGQLGAALTLGGVDPRNPDQLKALAPDRSAPSVLAAAIYSALSHPEPEAFPLAMGLAGFAPDGRSASAATGALLGALYGSTPLVRHGAGRLELAWPCEAIGTDLAMTALLSPLGHEPSGEPWLPSWDTRY